MLTMIEDIRTVFKEHIDALDWMDEPTKQKAKLKVMPKMTDRQTVDKY